MYDQTNFIERFGRRIESFGYALAHPAYGDIRKQGGSRDLFRLLNKPWLPAEAIGVVVDVGANEGQFIHVARKLVPAAAIYAFEPLPAVADSLEQSDWKDAKLTVVRAALGAEAGSASLNVSAFSPASSILAPTRLQSETFPQAAVSGQIEVPVDRLDRWLPEFEAAGGEILLKIDVQGFEDRVIEGAQQTLRRTAVAVVEVNLVEFYRDQCSFDQLLRLMSASAFRPVDIGGIVRRAGTAEIMYMDVAFKRVARAHAQDA